MSVIDDVAAKLGKPAGSVSILDLMNAGVPAVDAMHEVSNRAEDQRTGKAPSPPPITPPGWGYTPQPTQPAIDLGKRVMPDVPVPTYNPLPPPARDERPPSRPSGSPGAGSPSSAPQIPPTVPLSLPPGLPQLPQLATQASTPNMLVLAGIGFLVLLVMGRR